MTNKKIPVVVIVGPTASGKTKLAVSLAKALNGEVISGDSMQIYRGMNIGTAKPTEEEMQGVVHRMIDVIDPSENYSVARYVKEAAEEIKKVREKNKLPIICGGTGLYIDSLINNVPFFEQEDTHPLREQLKKEYDADGGEALWNELLQGDPEAATKIHRNNEVKIIRAVEVLRSGRTLTGQKEITKATGSPYEAYYFGLDFADRELLYRRVELRVDEMLKTGLLEEAEWLKNLQPAPSSTALAAIGYKELFAYFNGEITLQQAADSIKIATRHYAKRQLTWFRRNKKIFWLEGSEDHEKIVSVVINRLKTFME